MKKATNPVRHFALLLVGTPKSGKTSVALCFPQPWAILDIDHNLAGPIHRLKEKPEYFFENADVDDNGDFLPAHKRWERACSFLWEAIHSPEVKTIIIDSLSGLAQYLQDHIIYHADADSKTKALKIAGESVMQMSYWTPFKNKMTSLLTACRASGKYFIVTCHETIIQDEEGRAIAYRPMINGQLKDNIAGYFSDCWRTEVSSIANEVRYKLRFAPRNLHQIGNSLGIPDHEIDVTDRSPTDVFNYLKKYLQ